MHAHWFPPRYMQLVREIGEAGGAGGARARMTYENPQRAKDPMFTAGIDERLAMMDRAGIRTHVLSFSSPNVWLDDARMRARLVAAFNDGCIELAAQHPGRFKVFANVPLPHAAEALAETERVTRHPDVVGVGMCTHVGELAIDDARFAPVYAEWDRRGLVVFLHPDGFCVDGVLDAYGMEWAIGAPFEDQIAVLRLIRSGMVQRYPRITWIVPHLGGTLPFLYDRIEQIGKRANLPPLRDQLATVLFDVVTPSPASLRLTREKLGVDRLVLGSDFPYVSREDLGMGERVMREAGFSDDDVADVMHRTIERRLPAVVAT